MNAEKSVGAIIVAGLAILCCAGPALLAAVGSIALSVPVLAGPVAIVAVVALIGLARVWIHHRSRRANTNAVDCCALESEKRKSNP
ncbi:MAG: hypothetical protein AB7P97_20265 [Hyphomonadaceae bacterium]